MALILRVDVDKPYGRSNVFRKLASKLAEDYWFPAFDSFGYLEHLAMFIQYCNSNNVKGFFYHRICTIPNQKIINLLIDGNHKVGLHTEDTRNFNSFVNEYKIFKDKVNLFNIESFTKHGSGNLKLGKRHYPPYEPEKYKEWSLKFGIGFFFGNGICKKEEDLFAKNNFFENMFWIEREYRHPDFFELQDVITAAKSNDVVVLIHPCNYHASKTVADDFKLLVQLSKDQNISWKVF